MTSAERSKDWRKNNPERSKMNSRKNHLRRTFGITDYLYDQMFDEQQGKCALCKKPEITTHNGKIKKLAVDHNHVTNKIRALLCASCNTALGIFERSNLFDVAKNYLVKHS